jgi:hypothetical protein
VIDAISVAVFVLNKFGPFEANADELQDFILAQEEYQMYVTSVEDKVDIIEIGVKAG